ncbi:MAG: diaminopimelate epimerase [Candidatus Jettenia sp.]|uniref:Diaminopimelate epimerase n=1 Tax=Candidatus Jettenia caeni TaxID=247490 RepID=I3II12_9BACT|nr:diaminopimelate epimerase [Candidatus Jettenia sp. AMX1]MBC6930442.1 diaminopimelate epimerase [Candidatus Jettenia sp.]NUN23598.1 diaminopimelate epimerase [Candidatus Jettenia caeni]KAA0246575.1 MAG: diaminopimelate epimerase [Candidatus Jettenia sp. AMX1]MCE7882053.1 diaminopimelate epimerase [Candidatus Jettenia sp. AMX1]MCQ3926312.1 diaminopimelate epimerase [Candidatus Jettenia sp.]
MRFTKMHGIGNDYIYINCFEEEVKEPAKLAPRMSDRHFGIGSDGIILILPSTVADCKMRIFNADGSEAQMCGNGVRCVAKYIYDHNITRNNPLTVETVAGIKSIELFTDNGRVSGAKVNMGKPRLLRSEIPMLGKEIKETSVIDELLTISNGISWRITCVSMGNPHGIIFVDNLDLVNISKHGIEIEHHPVFPERINVHFVQVHNPKEVTMRTWERGSGITLACGTGASAVCVAGVLNKKTERKILAHLPGGDLKLEWAEDGNVYMTGPAAEVFTGEWH